MHGLLVVYTNASHSKNFITGYPVPQQPGKVGNSGTRIIVSICYNHKNITLHEACTNL